MRQGIALATDVGTVADTSAQTWIGGRTALVIKATTYPTTCKLQLLAQDASTWIDINGTTFSADQCTTYDLPPGQYRMHLTGGTASHLYASLVAIPYT